MVRGCIWGEVAHPQPVPVQEGQQDSSPRSDHHDDQQEACANFSTSIVHKRIPLQAATTFDTLARVYACCAYDTPVKVVRSSHNAAVAGVGVV